jgi:hypothetical protein
VNGHHIFVCPWTGLSRPHRYGFPTFTGNDGTLDFLTGSYMTPGCALKHLESLVVEKKVSEKKAKEMLRALVDFLGSEVSAMTVKKGTLAEMIESSGIPIPGHFSELNLFGGPLSERDWGTKYKDTESMMYTGFVKGGDFLPPLSKQRNRNSGKTALVAGQEKNVNTKRAVPYSPWLMGKREKEMKEKTETRGTMLLIDHSIIEETLVQESHKRKEREGPDMEKPKEKRVKRPTVIIPPSSLSFLDKK